MGVPLKIQKQPSRGVLSKRCSENMQQIYRRTPMPKCDFNKIALQLYWNHTLALVFSCKFAVYFQNTSGWLILRIFFGTMEGVWKLRSHFSYKSNSKERNLQHPGKKEEIWIQWKSSEKFIQQHDESNRFSIFVFPNKIAFMENYFPDWKKYGNLNFYFLICALAWRNYGNFSLSFPVQCEFNEKTSPTTYQKYEKFLVFISIIIWNLIEKCVQDHRKSIGL